MAAKIVHKKGKGPEMTMCKVTVTGAMEVKAKWDKVTCKNCLRYKKK
jgi:hypothetical protein